MSLVRAKKRIGIGIRLAIMVAVLILIATGGFTIFSLVSQRRESMKMFAHSSLLMGRSLVRVLRFSMLENRREEIESAIKQIAMEEVIENVSLVTHTGELRYSSDPGAAGQVSIDEDGCSGCHVGGGPEALKRLPAGADVSEVEGAKVIKVSLPIFNAPECYGGACHVHSETESVLGVM